MAAPQSTSPRELYLIGAALALLGGYGVLIGLGMAPVPGGRANLHGPLWIALLLGLIGLLAGAAMVIQPAGGADVSGELPPGAPRPLRAAQYFLGTVLFALFAAVGAWVALAGDARQFSGGLPWLGVFNVALARLMFGFGALICAAAAVAYAVTGVRRLRGAAQEPSAR
jgi:hypothetical protein